MMYLFVHIHSTGSQNTDEEDAIKRKKDTFLKYNYPSAVFLEG